MISSKSFKTAYELHDMIVEQASALYGPWPTGMTLFVFEDSYGWAASVSWPISEGDNFYRTRTLDLITMLKSSYGLHTPRLPGASELW